MPPFARVLVVTKETAYASYARRRDARARALLQAGDPTVEGLRRADEHHRETVDEVRDALATLGVRARFRDRTQLGDVADFDLIVTVGGDGTFLSVSHAVGATPMMGVNSAPYDSVGYLCSARRGNVLARMRAAVTGKLAVTRLARMRVAVDGAVIATRVLNDVLFTHRNPAMTSRYVMAFRGTTEEHRSSGVWIGPAAGSTAAIRSAGGRVLAARSRLVQFVVREPFQSGPPFECVRGLARPGETVEVWNQMREAALFVDGPRTVVPLELGQRVRFDLSPERLAVVGFARGTSALGARRR